MVDTFAFQIEWTAIGMVIGLLTAVIAVLRDDTGISPPVMPGPPLPLR